MRRIQQPMHCAGTNSTSCYETTDSAYLYRCEQCRRRFCPRHIVRATAEGIMLCLDCADLDEENLHAEE